jgi:hypothetical protein
MINTFHLIPSNDKGIGYIKDMAFEIIRESEATFRNEVLEMHKLWNSYNNNFDASKYDYLTKVEGDLTYPAKVRDIASQLLRSSLNVLESEQARRKIRLKAAVCDERSQQKKYEERMKAVMDAIEASVEEQYAIIESAIQEVQDELNDLEQQLQVQPDNEEVAAQLQQLKTNMPAIRLEYGKMIRQLNRQGADINTIGEKIKYFRQYNEVELIESIANAFIKSKTADPMAREDFNKGFKEKIVTDRPTYIVNYNEKTNKVDFHQFDAIRSFYSRSSSAKWTDEVEWCSTLEYQSLSQCAAEFDLDISEISMLRSYITGDMTSMTSYNNNIAVFNLSDSAERAHGGIPVWRVWWLSPREYWRKKSINKNRPGSFFNHVIVDKPIPNKIKADDIIERNILYDRYSAVIIGNVICKSHGVDRFVYRPQDTPGYPTLPMVARTFNTISENANSLIKRTEDVRELYNIILYSLELNIVLSGVRGMIMDKSQKPDSMSTKQWMYYRKLGTMWIETMKKGRKVPASFNQFQNYDDTLSQSIAITIEVLGGLEDIMGKIIGITSPRLGQTVAKDPVHNVMMSQEQSSLITEVLYYESDLVYARAMSLYLNLVFQHELKQDKVINYFDEQLQEILFKIPSSLMEKSDFTIHARNNIQEDHNLDIMRTSAMNRTDIPLNSLASLWNIDSMKDMEVRLKQIVEEQLEMQTQASMNVDTNRAQQEQRTLQMKAELEQYSANMKGQIEQAKIELDKIRLDSDLKYKQWEIDFKERELKSKTDISLLGVASENEVESAYLSETQRSNRVQEMLEANRQKIEALINIGNMKLSKDQGEKKNEVEIKKAELAATRRKNNIKD